ncbi:MAG: DUF4213 domain-containing protein, partial [Anaerolineae bacterium]|nr:DUF4213 domain-containing protein [Anaerolineae bacterium]
MATEVVRPSADLVRRLVAAATAGRGQPAAGHGEGGRPPSGRIADVRIGTHWTVVVVETPVGQRAGLAATQIVHDLAHGRPAVRDAGHLIGRDACALAELALSDSLTERSLGFATINALLEVDEAKCVDLNAEEAILAHGRGRRVAIVGHFPFVP